MDKRQPRLRHWPEAGVALAGLVGVVARVLPPTHPAWVNVAVIGGYILCAAGAITGMELRSRRVERESDEQRREVEKRWDETHEEWQRAHRETQERFAELDTAIKAHVGSSEQGRALEGARNGMAAAMEAERQAIQRSGETHFRLGVKAGGKRPTQPPPPGHGEGAR